MRHWPTLREELGDSPHFGRDVNTLLSAWRLAAWFSVLLLLVLGTLGIGLLVLRESRGEVTTRLELGEYLAALQFLAVAAFLTVFVPLRSSGAFEGPRWQRYFDQVVLSGISPTRYLAGKVLGANLFCGVVLLVTGPFILLTAGLGGVGLGRLLLALAALWLYSNVLVFATLASGVCGSELLGTPAVIVGFVVLFILGLCPLPPVVGFCSPVHWLAQPLFTAAEAPEANALTLTFGSLELHLGSLPIYLGGASLILLAAALLVALGPLRCFTLPTSTFGEVVRRGDSRRSRFARHRPALQRRAELCFFYENRAAWLGRYELPLRWGGLAVAIGLLGAAAFTVLHTYARQMQAEEFLVANGVVFGVMIIIATAVFASDCSTAATRVAWGRFTCHAARADTLAFAAVAWLFLALAFLLPAARDFLSSGTWLRTPFGMGPWTLSTLWELHLVYGVLATLSVLEYYALVRLFGRLFWSGIAAWLAGSLVFFGFLLLAPLIAGLLFGAAARNFADAEPLAPFAAAWFATLSPLTAALALADPHFASPELADLGNWGIGASLLGHLALTALLVVVAGRRPPPAAWELPT